MNLKTNLEKLKMIISNSYSPKYRENEFETNLENHNLGNQKIYRLYYINYHRIGENCDRDYNIGSIDCPFKPFMFPPKMSSKEGFKVLSYLTDFIEKTYNLEPCSYQSVAILDNILNIERLGFKRITNNTIKNSDVIDLFTVSGRLLLFKQSIHYPKYFEWYTENVTFDEVKKIYNQCNIEFYDLIPIKNYQEKLKPHNDLQLIKRK